MSFARRRDSAGSVGWAAVAWALALGTFSVGFVRADLITTINNGSTNPPHSNVARTIADAAIVMDVPLTQDPSDVEGSEGVVSSTISSYFFSSATFDFSLEHTISELDGALAENSGTVRFIPNATGAYTLGTGEGDGFSWSPEGGTYAVSIAIDLVDITAGNLSLVDVDHDNNSSDDPFTFDESGFLTLDHIYELSWTYSIDVTSGVSSGSAGGFFSLAADEGITVVQIPAPPAALLAMFGLSLVAGRRTRRSRG